MNKILVLEDDDKLNQGISYALKEEGYQVYQAFSCFEGKNIIESNSIDLIILDVNLPDHDGFSFCKWVKSKYSLMVLFLSARDLESDLLKGYELGGDDYVTKPFSLKVLMKKIAVMLSKNKQNIFQDDFLYVNFDQGLVKVEGQSCLVTPTEYRILKILIEHKDKLLTYSLFLDLLWEEKVELLDKHALHVNINRLRKKIEDEKHRYINNVYGMGYIWK